jgi:hypothetical protein
MYHRSARTARFGGQIHICRRHVSSLTPLSNHCGCDAWCGRNVCTAVVMCVDVEMYVGQVELFGDVDDGVGVAGV